MQRAAANRAACHRCASAAALVRRLCVNALVLAFILSGVSRRFARNFSEDLHKAAAAHIAGFLGICAAPKRRAIGIKTNGQWIRMLAHHGQQRSYISSKVGALFAVKLDADEIRVHQRRHLFVFKAFMVVADDSRVTPPHGVVDLLAPCSHNRRGSQGCQSGYSGFMLQQIRGRRLERQQREPRCKCAIAHVLDAGQILPRRVHKTV